MCDQVSTQRSIQEVLSTSTAAGGDPNPRPTGYSTNLIAVSEDSYQVKAIASRAEFEVSSSCCAGSKSDLATNLHT